MTMATVDPSKWTGRKNDGGPFAFLKREQAPFSIPHEVDVLERPAPLEPTPAAYPKSAPLPQAEVDAMREAALKEYSELAEYVGIMPPDLTLEAFKSFLRDSTITVFSLADVISYMDEKAAKESKDKAGWEWRPLREKDQRKDLAFGRPAEREWTSSRDQSVIKPASDYYRGPHEETRTTGGQWVGSGLGQQIIGTQQERFLARSSASAYDRTIPLHAVRKIAQIEKGFKGDVAFFVCDYALAPAIQYPDPFLMAVVPNPKANIGVGRFIIDFWDEPGFGIEHMVKSDL
jgi:hypothetical protein